MRILVTGSSGFIGGWAARWLSRAGLDVIGLDNRPLPDFSPLAATRERARFETVKGDIRDPSLVHDLMRGVDAVVHLAAFTGVIPSVENPKEAHDVNCTGTQILMEAARAAGTSRVVFASTGGAIAGERPPPVTEEVVPRPASPYGATKLYGEGLMSSYAEAYGFHTVSLRFSNVYGPGSVEKGSIVAEICKALVHQRPLTVYGDGSATRDFVHVADIAQAIELALDHGTSGEAYLVGTGTGTSVSELIDLMEEVSGETIEVRHDDARQGEIHTTYSDITKARRELGFEPRYDLREGLVHTWRWFDGVVRGTSA